MTLAVGAGCRARGCFEYPVKVGEVFKSAIKTDFEDFFGARALFPGGKFHAGGIDSLCGGDAVEPLEAGIHMLGGSSAASGKRLCSAGKNGWVLELVEAADEPIWPALQDLGFLVVSELPEKFEQENIDIALVSSARIEAANPMSKPFQAGRGEASCFR